MPALPEVTHRNCKTKEHMQHYLDNTLRPALDNHVLLRAALQAGVDAWAIRLGKMEDAPPGKLTEPDKTLFVDPAFVQGHQELSDKYFESIDELSRREVGSKAYGKTVKKVRRLQLLLHDSSRNYDLKLRRYDDAYSAYQEENEDDAAYQRRIAPYKDEFVTLRGQLRGFVTTFNSRFPFDEPYDRGLDTDWSFQFSQRYEQYVPTQHRWFPEVSSGTYIYDYQRNLMQVHLHYNAARDKVTAVRFKLYGEEQGTVSDKNWGMIGYLTKTYVPQFDGAWHRA